MAYTTIDDPTQYFNTLTWSGDNTSPRSITGVGFQPDWVWAKPRNANSSHVLWDSSRGVGKSLHTDYVGVTEETNSQFGYLSAFNSDGFTSTQGTYGGFESANLNMTGRTYVAWNWRANGGTTSSNTDGSITSTVQANTTAGFSIVLYIGNATNGATVGHGLGKVPSMVITKARDDAPSHWRTYHSGLTDHTYAVTLNDTHAQTTGYGLNASPTSSVFELTNSSQRNQNTINYLAYCFAEIKGYSKFGTYTGNGTGSFGPFANGPFVYTGFKPAWVMIKRTDGANGWTIFDNKRDPFNIVGNQITVNSGGAEEADAAHHAERDFLSNGFKLKGNGNDVNANGASYLYMAFAEHPFVSSEGVPVTAR